MPNYIMDLRKIVGHQTLQLVGASVIIENNKGQILLQQRADNLCWGNAGGGIELDEEVEVAAKRELFEETGLIANTLELFDIFSGPQLHYTYPNGDDVSCIDIVYLCKDYSGKLTPQLSEVEQLQFFDATNLPENLSPTCHLAIEKWAKTKLHPFTFLSVESLNGDELVLVLTKTTPTDAKTNHVPAYHFDIFDLNRNLIGRCSLRVGYNENIYYGGNIGYTIFPQFRGNYYAAKACTLLFKLAKQHDLSKITITCAKHNIASRKTCEKLNGTLIEIAPVPKDHPMRQTYDDDYFCIYQFSL